MGDAAWGDVYIHTPQSYPPALRAVATASLPAEAGPLDLVLTEMVIATEAGVPVPFDLVGIFRVSQSPVLSAAFVRFLSNSDPRLVAIGLRGSAYSGDPSLILTVRQKYASVSSSGAWPALLDEIKFYYLNTSPQAIQALGQAATDGSTGADLRAAAAGALSRMHTQQTLPYLATLLSDQDSTIRTMAAGGMASFANNVPIGSHEPATGPWPYRTDDTIAHSAFNLANVSFWRTWWQQNQNKLTQ